MEVAWNEQVTLGAHGRDGWCQTEGATWTYHVFLFLLERNTSTQRLRNVRCWDFSKQEVGGDTLD